MGFPLPAVGYVTGKGRGVRPRRNNKLNDGNLRYVEEFMNSVQNSYELHPDSELFFFPPRWRDREPIGAVYFEPEKGIRATLQEVLYDLRNGGTVIVPRIADLLECEDDSIQLLLDYKSQGIAFLSLDALPFGRIRSIDDVRHIAHNVLMDTRSQIDYSIRQYKRRFGLEPRPIEEPVEQDAA